MCVFLHFNSVLNNSSYVLCCVWLEAVAKRRNRLKQKKDRFSSLINAAEVVKINLNWVAHRKIGQGCCQIKGEMSSLHLTAH